MQTIYTRNQNAKQNAQIDSPTRFEMEYTFFNYTQNNHPQKNHAQNNYTQHYVFGGNSGQHRVLAFFPFIFLGYDAPVKK